MPIGKDSIQKRIAKTPAAVTSPVADAATVADTLKTAKEVATAPAVGETTHPKETVETLETVEMVETATPVSATGVMANVSPEVVEKVTGHPEGKGEKHVQLFDEMPHYLL